MKRVTLATLTLLSSLLGGCYHVDSDAIGTSADRLPAAIRDTTQLSCINGNTKLGPFILLESRSGDVYQYTAEHLQPDPENGRPRYRYGSVLKAAPSQYVIQELLDPGKGHVFVAIVESAQNKLRLYDPHDHQQTEALATKHNVTLRKSGGLDWFAAGAIFAEGDPQDVRSFLIETAQLDYSNDTPITTCTY